MLWLEDTIYKIEIRTKGIEEDLERDSRKRHGGHGTKPSAVVF